MDLNEKIIECVRTHNCLYEPANKNYKNAVLKARLWQQIAEQLNQTSEAVKRKWKSMRDGYIKYKKQSKGTTGSGRKSFNFMWSAQLSFLDSSINPRETSCNIPGDPPIETSENSAMPATATYIENESFESVNPISPIRPSSNESIETSYRKKKTREPDFDVDDMIKNYLGKKAKSKHDAVDYLFLSYAQTFKKLSHQKQAMLKVDIAKLFSDAELSEMLSTEHNQSPAYAVISPIPDNTNSGNRFICTNVEQIQLNNMPQDLSNATVHDNSNMYSIIDSDNAQFTNIPSESMSLTDVPSTSFNYSTNA